MKCRFCGQHNTSGAAYSQFCDAWRRYYIDRVEQWQASNPIKYTMQQVNRQGRQREAADTN